MSEQSEKVDVEKIEQESKELQETIKEKKNKDSSNPISLDKAGKAIPKTLEEAYRISHMMVKEKVVPKNITSATQALAIIQCGADLGMNAFTSLKSIAMIDGTPSLHTDGPLGLVLKSGLLEDIEEYAIDKSGAKIDFLKHALGAEKIHGYVSIVTRKGMKPHAQVYTIEMAKSAGLYPATDRSGRKIDKMPWNAYTDVMLKRRARSMALKDRFADVLGGLNILEYDMHTTFDYGPLKDVTESKSKAQEFNRQLSERSATGEMIEPKEAKEKEVVTQ